MLSQIPREQAAAAPAPAAAAPPPRAKKKPSMFARKAKVKQAKCKFDFDSAEAGDLSLKTGDIVDVAEVGDDGWWTGGVDGRTGIFPGGYVELI